jgi:siroheme synthase-like protein
MIALRLGGARCVVVGSEDDAATRAERLAQHGAQVTLVSETPSDRVRAAARLEGIVLVERPFEEPDLEGCRLAVLVDRDPALAARLDATCRDRNVLFCAVDQPFGDFAHVATVRRGPLSLGISTDGRAPALARRFRQLLTELVDDDALDAFVAHLEALRATAPAEGRSAMLNLEAKRLTLPTGLRVAPADDDAD